MPLQGREGHLQIPGRRDPRPADRRADPLHGRHVPLPAQPRAHGRHHAAARATRDASRASCAAPIPAISGTCGSSAPSSRAACRSRSSSMPAGRGRHAAPVHSGAARGQSQHGGRTIRATSARLEGLGSRALVQAMRWGDWDVIEGAFFDCWSHRRHVVDPFGLPDHWPRFRSGDWGSAAPSSFGWWAVVTEPLQDRGGHLAAARLPGALPRILRHAAGPAECRAEAAGRAGRRAARRAGAQRPEDHLRRARSVGVPQRRRPDDRAAHHRGLGRQDLLPPGRQHARARPRRHGRLGPGARAPDRRRRRAGR